jgi:hypothetical protein
MTNCAATLEELVPPDQLIFGDAPLDLCPKVGNPP